MRIRFGRFELDDERYVLTRGGEPVELRPKVFDLLVALVRERRRVVRREELFAALWSTTAVGPGSLAGLVNELRRALGEDGRGPSSIRTVHARGYQFAADVEVLSTASTVSATPVARAATTEAMETLAPIPVSDPSGPPDAAGAASLATRLQRAYFEVQRSGPRALFALMPDERKRSGWLAVAGARARAIGFEARWLVVSSGADPETGELASERMPAAARATDGPGDASLGRDPIVLCLDVEALADWRRSGGLRRCLDLMGRAPVLVLAAIAARPDERTVHALVEGDPRIDCVAADGDDERSGREARGGDRGPDLVETLRQLASLDQTGFEHALRGMGFEARVALPVRKLRRVEPAPARTGRAHERELG